MDLFDHRYYRLSKILMLLIGQWPYQKPRAKRGILAVIFILIGSELVPQILAVVKYRDNDKMLVQCLILYVLGAIAVMKLLSFMVHSQKVSYNFVNYNDIVITGRETDDNSCRD